MTVVEQLLDLQEVDGRIRELEHELKDLPRRKALETARLSGVIADLDAAKANQQYVTNRVRGYEEDAKALREKIQQLKTVQSGLDSNKEYAQYSIQIDLVSHDLETTENNQLSAMDDLPSAESRIKEAQEKYDALKSNVDAVCAELDERLAMAKSELDEAMRERNEKATAVSDPRARLYYERLRTKRWPVVVPLIHSVSNTSVCDGCHLVQPPSVSQLVDANAKNAAEGKPLAVVACTMCGRMLYRA